MTALVLSCLWGNSHAQQGVAGNHPEIPRWCGKPYEAGSPNFDPGGWLLPPAASADPMLHVQLNTRHSIYVSSESTGELIVDAGLSFTHGAPYTNRTPAGYNETSPFDTLQFDVRLEETNEPLVTADVAINTTSSLFQIDLQTLEPRLTPYKLVLYGAPVTSYPNQSYTATTELYYLPKKQNGSTVKIDNLNGGMLVANIASNPLLAPFGFYTSCDGYLNYSLTNVTTYKDLGFNAINPVCAYPDGGLTDLFNWVNSVGLWYQYDMRNYYLNLSSVRQQIPLVKDDEYFLSWYTADEPDGTEDALNSTSLTYDLLKREDPYHPTSLVLNCHNFHFEQYASGADYIMTDPYPVGINATWSRRWNTTVNETYGDCGCDDCVGELRDVSRRLDAFFDYQDWLGKSQKPLWAVLQGSIREDYWARDPTIEETWAMQVLSFIHKAKAIMSWDFHEVTPLNRAHGAMAKAVTQSPVSDFLLGSQPTQIYSEDFGLLEAAYWRVDDQLMIGIANMDYVGTTEPVAFDLPINASRIASQPWGSVEWELANKSLVARGLEGLATSFVILDQ
ncbi:hypothetical protein D0867_03690 [Hortaea werneckii]|uniref:Uncharacterized protein n=1 Tax=Hortaea werneckii TaxID=91943 RepID=A0A3M6ZZY4_HORWE|nr:hypothetical protein D0867_03690 [Hortaea werneckii]